MSDWAELSALSNFSFLKGASHPQEMVAQAAALGYAAIGLADVNTLAGQVRAHKAAAACGIRFLPGARLRALCGFEVIAYPCDRAAYAALSQCLTQANLRSKKGSCQIDAADIIALAQATRMVWIIVPGPQAPPSTPPEIWRRLLHHAGAHCYLLLAPYYTADDRSAWAQLRQLAQPLGLKLLAGSDALYHHPERRPLHDAVSCIRLKKKIFEAGYDLAPNAERHIRARDELARLFRDHPDALTNMGAIVAQCDFSLAELAYQYPEEICPAGETPQQHLVQLTYAGAEQRFPDGIPAALQKLLTHELALIAQLDYAPYFLTVYDIVRYARSRRILCQGRGSAANSAVCYCLGITAVDPSRLDLLFERFVSAERNEPPDIDVDFEHERREEVIQYIYQKYGRARAGIAATVITYRARSAIGELAKVMGLSPDISRAMLSLNWGGGSKPPQAEHIRSAGLDPDEPLIQTVLHLAAQLIGFPRHLSQHVGGFVITRDPLDTLVPIANAAMAHRTFIEWDKDDLDAMGMLKVDVLALGMLSAIRRSFDLLAAHYGLDYDLASIPPEDPAVYDMLCRAESTGVFQVESRAQMNMLPRLKPRDFYDLVIQVAIVRPGPIQGDMVHPYLRRRNGEELVAYPSAELESVLGKTLGVPLFQEQAMRIAVVAAGFSPAEADQLRRAMAAFRKTGMIEKFSKRFLDGMAQRGYAEDFSRRCFQQIEGFGEYGFPESHAASFALLVYVSAWLKCHYPAVFTAALLNSQPMGFYAPAQLVREAQRQNVRVLPVCVNTSSAEADLEVVTENGVQQIALRLGFNQISGLPTQATARLLQMRAAHAFDSIADCVRRTALPLGVFERLARADGFAGLGLQRRQALWILRGLPDDPDKPPLPLFATLPDEPVDDIALPPLSIGAEVVEDYASLRLSLKAHPIGLLRPNLAAVRPLRDLDHIADGKKLNIAGLVICRQRPGSARGVVFLTLEDEDRTANIVVWPDCFERYRRSVIAGRLLEIQGHVQRQGAVVHLVARHIIDRSALLTKLGDVSEATDPQWQSSSARQIGRRTPRELPWRGQ
jgi:error-prone DNA polymerase